MTRGAQLFCGRWKLDEDGYVVSIVVVLSARTEKRGLCTKDVDVWFLLIEAKQSLDPDRIYKAFKLEGFVGMVDQIEFDSIESVCPIKTIRDSRQSQNLDHVEVRPPSLLTCVRPMGPNSCRSELGIERADSVGHFPCCQQRSSA